MHESTPGNGSSSYLIDVEQVEAAGHSISAGHGASGWLEASLSRSLRSRSDLPPVAPRTKTGHPWHTPMGREGMAPQTSIKVDHDDSGFHMSDANQGEKSAVLHFTPGEWDAFLRGVNAGEFDFSDHPPHVPGG
ncbi:DUF397 domain-containing protein [Actinopolymorpha alba]|uniref:DUF397 domain-containing protein n=1 Tax=Actinopolymorpha alba TaxID=533267 RepID=UPI00035C3889|nr:DUF397 domain-containing protein [Actinopolymorpha alba]